MFVGRGAAIRIISARPATRSERKDDEETGVSETQFPDFRLLSYCSRILYMPRGNPSPKLAITIDPDIHQNILAAAAREGVSVSAWMTTAAREALLRRAGLAAVARWEKQHGRFTTEEMNEARRSVRAQLRTPRTVRRPA